jgi:uncharacterized protein YjbI with pentapeptide repeats
MAKKASAKTTTPPPGKLAGKTVAFVGKFGPRDMWLDQYRRYVTGEKGKVVDAEKAVPDYLVAGEGRGGNPPAAVAKIQKKHPSVQVVDEAGLCQLLLPSPDELCAELRAGPMKYDRDERRWEDLRYLFHNAGATLDLRGADLRGTNLFGAELTSAHLDGADLRTASAHYAHFGVLSGVNLDGADLSNAYFLDVADCTFRKANLTDAWFGFGQMSGAGKANKYEQCDFSGAKLAQFRGEDCTFTECIFAGAQLPDAKIEEADFSGSNLSAADLSRAHGQKSRFEGANLSKAVLFRADLRDACLKDADLRKADLREAVLSGADLSGAKVDGADFAGAVLTGAKLDGLDARRAKNFQPPVVRTPGPHILELAKIASASKSFETKAEVDLGKGEHATLSINRRFQGNRPFFAVWSVYQRDGDTAHDRLEAATLEEGMLKLADRWPGATLRFDSISAGGSRTLRGQKLLDLAMSAWAEAFGLEAASPETLHLQKKEQQSAVQALRETMLAELGGGPAGVKKWNARSVRERDQIGPLRELDLNRAKLAGVNLDDRDLQGSQFRGANLKKASLWSSKLQSADFSGADLTGARMAFIECENTSFEGAKMVGCDIHIAILGGTNFRGADLKGAKLDFSSLNGADFTDANLDGVDFNQARYDQDTKFPKGFVPPREMEWTGPPRAVAAASAGTLDFPTFFGLLRNKIDPGRLGKALAMLKAERFQLFAEVKDDSLVGVVKSQSSADLVYSCRLTAEGKFSCCTQNLFACGGLRGALCKHLLVLVVGLTKAGQLDPATVDAWVEASKQQKPHLDKDVMSDTFVRYKGVEAGEVDWRPTETIPEDYYAL